MAKQRRSRTDLHERSDAHGQLAAAVYGRRERLGLRQEELADLAGCSARFVLAVETGKPTVRLDKVVDVLNALGLHLEVLNGAAQRVSVGSGLRTELGLGDTHPNDRD